MARLKPNTVLILSNKKRRAKVLMADELAKNPTQKIFVRICRSLQDALVAERKSKAERLVVDAKAPYFAGVIMSLSSC